MTDHMHQQPDEILENSLGLDAAAITPVVQNLNRTLATLYTFYHQIKKHHWVVEGPEYMPLHKFLDEWAATLLKQGDAVAERITALGGYPISGPVAHVDYSLVHMEPEGVFHLRTMLKKDLEDGRTIAETCRDQIPQAIAAGDWGTEQLLKGILLEHEMMVHHLEHFLGDESLTRDLLH
ncbi:MAG TPA: DNA starvation/stationary phase protection protein DpsA [Symbiobacteriaceae bacterium]|nr:DNA starvation/stationary phase protection protein DpsA [Symbiobacteriaceae bacterium]